jgi:hypothetical protein
MRRELEDAAMYDLQALKDPVAVDEAMVEDGHLRVLPRHETAIQPDLLPNHPTLPYLRRGESKTGALVAILDG